MVAFEKFRYVVQLEPQISIGLSITVTAKKHENAGF